jgi:hypothetical protein
MGKGASTAAKKQTIRGDQLAEGYGGRASEELGTLAPLLTAEATNPQGFSEGDLAGMNTGVQQSLGGATAGAFGQAALRAARNRNVGGPGAVLDEAVREGGRTLSQKALDIQTANALQREKNRQAGLAGLASLYGHNVGASEDFFNAANQGIGLRTQANAQTLNDMLEPINTLVGASMSGAKIATGGH